MRGLLVNLDSSTACKFLLPRHYSGRKPNISKAFGWEIDGELVAVCTFGKPASNTLCNGICGKENSHHVYELNRLCRVNSLKEPLSSFVSACLRMIKSMDWIVVSYSDMGMSHHGYIYQACSFIYTGETKERLEFYTGGGHSRHGSKDSPFRKIRTAKHRYVKFCTKNKALKKKWVKALKYERCPYPKGQNADDYKEGFVLKPKIVSYTKGLKS